MDCFVNIYAPMLTYLMPPEDVHVRHDVGPEEVSIIYGFGGPIYNDCSLGSRSRINGNTYFQPILSLAPKVGIV